MYVLIARYALISGDVLINQTLWYRLDDELAV